LKWYSGTCGTGTLVGTGTPLTIAAPTTTTTYFARWEATNCTPSACVNVIINVTPAPTNPTSATADRTAICSNDGGTIVLSATGGSGGILKWYSGTCGTGTLVGTGTPLTIAAPTTTTTYFARWEATNCTPSACVNVIINVTPAPTDPTLASADRTAICSNDGGSITLTATGGSGGTLKWYSGTCGTGTFVGAGTPLTIAAPTTTTTYFARWEATNCTPSVCVNVIINVTPAPTDPTSADADRKTLCSNDGGSIVLSATGGSGGTLKWYSGTCGTGILVGTGTPLTIAAPTTTTTYFARWEATNCTSSACVNVIINVTPAPVGPTSANADRTALCSNDGGNIVLTATGGSGGTLIWYGGSCGTGIPLGTGTPLTIVAPTTTTTYFARWETTNCSPSVCASIQVNVSTTPATPIVVAGDTTVFCTGGHVDLNITSSTTGFTIQWYKNNVLMAGETGTTLTTSIAGNYSVTISGAGNCSATSSASAVVVNQLPTVTASAVGSGSCVGQTVQLLAQNPQGGSGVYLFEWTAKQDPSWSRSSQNPSFTAPDSTTEYLLVLQDASTNSLSCSYRDSTTINVASPYVNMNPIDSMCKGTGRFVGAIVSNNTAGISYSWQAVGSAPIGYLSDPAILNPFITIPANASLPSVQYKLTIQDNGCTIYRDILVDINSVPTLTVSTNDTVVCGGGSAALHALIVNQTSPNYTYNWLHIKNPGPGNDTLGKNITSASTYDFSAAVQSQPESNFFFVTLVDHHGCVGLSDTIEVKAYDKQNLMVPNLITPNNDNKNECFIIKDVNNFDILPGSSLEVYNRWGEAVFKASNYSNQQPWCGGSLTDGVYYYHIKTGCGEQVIKGWIEILSNEAKN
jgi:gliding motility-associated-like protein